ncbi:MAG: NAD-dependent epimerase/dehydratase family protein [Lachnospiraceae bacterium]|nr:NAD-dependent epimerase/dehydratase family protein [Lachnospiraceae bacterium]
MNLLILGGTGAMGEAIIPILADDSSNNIYVTSRSERESELKNVTYIQGNARNEVFISELLEQKWDVIIDFMIYTTEEFRNRVDKLLANTGHYLFFSSARVFAKIDGLTNEESERLLDVCKDEEYLATDEYALKKARQENLLMNNEKRNWTIIRPYITYNNYRLQLGNLEKENWLYRALNGKNIIFSKDMLEKYTTMTYAHDVVSAVVKLINEPLAQGEVFNIAHQKAYKWKEILDMYIDILKEYNIYPKITYIDRMSDLCPGAKYQIWYDRLFDRCFDNRKISKYIEVEEFCDLETGLRKCLDAFIKKPIWREINVPFHLRMDELEEK